RTYLFWGGLTLAIQITAGYFAVVVYTCIILVLYAVLAGILLKSAKTLFKQLAGQLFAASALILLGITAAAPQFYSTFITFRSAWRSGFDFFFYSSGSFPPFVLLSFVFPFLFGGAFSLPLLFPWDVVGDSGFIGILPTFTAIMAAIVLRKSRRDVRIWSIIAL